MDKMANNQKSDAAMREETTLAFWNERKIFEKSLQKEAPNGEYVFYDGPPFATGTPHYGHIVASVIKDAVPRYWTMRGYRVPRQWGWDCHGLPIENIVEKELGFKHKKDIVAFGIAQFNEACRSKVLMYADEWKKGGGGIVMDCRSKTLSKKNSDLSTRKTSWLSASLSSTKHAARKCSCMRMSGRR